METIMHSRVSVIDCFCGAGGLSLGFSLAGFRPIFAFDNDMSCINTYNSNIGGHGFVMDACDVTKNSIEISIGMDCNAVTVVAGGPPCQGFSVQRRGPDEDERNKLVLEFARIALEIRPLFIVIENVGGLLSSRGRPFCEHLLYSFVDKGYRTYVEKADVYDYGVPQHRKRVFIIGQNKEMNSNFRFPKPTRPFHTYPRTVRDAIGDLQHLTEDDIPNHRADNLSEINLQRIRALKEGEGREHLPPHLRLKCHTLNKNHRHLDVYGRMSWDLPSPTITARFDSFSRGRFGHPALDRSITLREGARLQSFPDDFIFIGTKVQVAKQIGNAVPPLMACAIAGAIQESMKKEFK